MTSLKSNFWAASALTLAMSASLPAFAEEDAPKSDLEAAIEAIKPIFNARLRYETVDQDGFAETADALTYRLRAGFETGEEIRDVNFLCTCPISLSTEKSFARRACVERLRTICRDSRLS